MAEHKKGRGSKILRGIVVTLMGLTVVLTLLGGAGTTCFAFGAEKYDSMIPFVLYKPLYQALVVISLAVGIRGIPVTVSLTTPIWAGPTHMSPAGYNWVTVLQLPSGATGWGMILAGAAVLLLSWRRLPRPGKLHNTLHSPSRRA